MDTLPDSTENDQNFINIMGPDFGNIMDSHLISNDSNLVAHLVSGEGELSSYGYPHLQNNTITPSVTALTYSISLENAPDIQDRMYSSNLTITTDVSPGAIIHDTRMKSSQPMVSNSLVSPPAYPDSTMQNLTIESPVVRQSNVSLNASPGSREVSHVKHLHADNEIQSPNLPSEFGANTLQTFDGREYNSETLNYGPYSNLLMSAPPLLQSPQLQHLDRPLNPYLEDPRDTDLESTYCINALKQESLDQTNGDSLFYSQSNLERYGLQPEHSENKIGSATTATSHIEVPTPLRGKPNKSTLSILNSMKKTGPVPTYLLPELQTANFSSVDARGLHTVYQQPAISSHCQSDLPLNGVYDNSPPVGTSDPNRLVFAYPSYPNPEYMQPTQSDDVRSNSVEKTENRKAPTRAVARSKAKRAKAASPINVDGAPRRGNSDESGVVERRRKSDNFNCGLCQTRCDSRSDLRKHLNEMHVDSGPEPADHPNKRYACGVQNCQFITYARGAYDEHVAVHIADGYTPTGKYRQGKAKQDLLRHRYNKEEFHCKKCPYICTIEASFKRHMKSHEMGLANIFTQSCPVCGDDFCDEPEQKEHMLTHRNDKYFLCDICQFNTVQLKKLIQHRRMHTGEKPHLCPYCHYRAARRDNLRSHVRRMHSKENMYSDTFTPKSMVFAEMGQSNPESQVHHQQLVQHTLANQM